MKQQKNGLQFEIRHLTLEQLVKLMTVNGAKKFTLETIESDIEKGFPLNDDGTVDLFQYSAWLFIKGYL